MLKFIKLQRKYYYVPQLICKIKSKNPIQVCTVQVYNLLAGSPSRGLSFWSLLTYFGFTNTRQIPICPTLAPLAHGVQFPSVTIASPRRNTVSQKEIKKKKKRKKTENRGNIHRPHCFGFVLTLICITNHSQSLPPSI